MYSGCGQAEDALTQRAGGVRKRNNDDAFAVSAIGVIGVAVIVETIPPPWITHRPNHETGVVCDSRPTARLEYPREWGGTWRPRGFADRAVERSGDRGPTIAQGLRSTPGAAETGGHRRSDHAGRRR